MTTDLHYTGAKKLAQMLRSRKVSATEVMQAFIKQVERVNPKLNAIVTFVPEQAMKQARALDRRRGPRPPLAGLPIAYKDLVSTKGIRTTLGSLVYADSVPSTDSALVERLSAAGAITLGKTNTPEFGAGSQTFNKVFGATRNPYDPTKTCGGSSGGAAVAVAAGMLPFADGSDLAASLRNPGNYCNVVGFRPTPGRVPSHPTMNGWDTQPVLGPLARTVEDTAFLFASMAGPDPRVPISVDEPGKVFARPLRRSFRRVRVAWTADFGGLPMDSRVIRALAGQRKVLESLGCIVEDACPDFSGAKEAFEDLRAVSFSMRYARLLKTHRGMLKDTVIWNIERGLAMTGERMGRAEQLRTELFQRMRAFMGKYEFFCGPVNQLPPYPVEVEWPREIAGTRMENYLDWMKSCYFVTITSHPAISVPAAFTDDPVPLPVGLQIVGRYRDDFGVLQLAHAFEQANPAWKRRPPLPV